MFKGYDEIQLIELFEIVQGSICPFLFAEEQFAHHSLPAFDATGEPAIEFGHQIESNKTLLLEPAILLSKLNPRISRVSIAEPSTSKHRHCCSTEFIAYKSRNPNTCLPFYKYLFQSQSFQNRLLNVATGTTNSHVRVKPAETLNWHVSHPTPPEQTKIAEILSTVDRAIEQTEALIAKQQRIKTGLMQDLLTRGIDEHGNLRSEQTHQFKDTSLGRIPVEWETIQIGNAASLQRGYDITESELCDGPYPVVSSSGIVGYHCECTSNGPNVVVGRKGTIGKVHYVENDFWAHDTSLYVTNFHGNSEKYFYYLFTHLDLARHGTKSGSPSLNRNDIHPLWIGLPKRIEQDRISTILMTCDQQANSFISDMEKAKQLKTALMQDLLTGKKRVTALLEKEAPML